MNTLDLLNKGSKKLKYKGIKSSQIDSEILLSKGLTAKTVTFSSYSPSEVGLYKVKYQNA